MHSLSCQSAEAETRLAAKLDEVSQELRHVNMRLMGMRARMDPFHTIIDCRDNI